MAVGKWIWLTMIQGAQNQITMKKLISNIRMNLLTTAIGGGEGLRNIRKKDFVDTVSDIDAGFNSDDDIVGKAVYDEEYLRSQKQQKVSSWPEADEEFRWKEENVEDDEIEEEHSSSTSEIWRINAITKGFLVKLGRKQKN